MNYLRNWWNNRQKKAEVELTNVIRAEFEVVERGGILFLTHNGVAFAQIGADTQASNIAESLNTARDVAQTYRKL